MTYDVDRGDPILMRSKISFPETISGYHHRVGISFSTRGGSGSCCEGGERGCEYVFREGVIISTRFSPCLRPCIPGRPDLGYRLNRCDRIIPVHITGHPRTSAQKSDSLSPKVPMRKPAWERSDFHSPGYTTGSVNPAQRSHSDRASSRSHLNFRQNRIFPSSSSQRKICRYSHPVHGFIR